MSKSRNTMPLNALRRSFAAVMALAVLLQMGYVSVSYAACSTKGTQRIAIGELKACCTPEAYDYTTLSQKCCDTGSFEAVFFSFKEKEADGPQLTPDFTPALSASAFFAERPLALRHVQQQLKIPPATGRQLLALHARLNV